MEAFEEGVGFGETAAKAFEKARQIQLAAKKRRRRRAARTR